MDIRGFPRGIFLWRCGGKAKGETLRTPPHHQQTEKTSEHRFKVRSQVHARAPDRVKGRERQVLGQRVGQVKARRGVLQSNKLIFDELTEEVYFP